MEAHFNRFDIVQAYYLYASHYHSGQGSPLYKVLCRCLKIATIYNPEELTENGELIYAALVAGDGKLRAPR